MRPVVGLVESPAMQVPEADQVGIYLTETVKDLLVCSAKVNTLQGLGVLLKRKVDDQDPHPLERLANRMRQRPDEIPTRFVEARVSPVLVHQLLVAHGLYRIQRQPPLDPFLMITLNTSRTV